MSARFRAGVACLLVVLSCAVLVAGTGVGFAVAAPASAPYLRDGESAGPDHSGDILRKGPYLMYTGDNTGVAILWQTNREVAEPTLEWGYTPACEGGTLVAREIEGGADGHLFRCDLAGLRPGSLVYYRLVIGDRWFSASFRAAPAHDATDATLYAMGDTQDNTWEYSRIAGALLDDVEALPENRQSICLHTGDFVSTGLDERAWDTEFFTRDHPAVSRFLAGLPVMGALGNHESYASKVGGDDPAGNGSLLRKYWPGLFSASPPHFYYSFDYGPAHVAVLDTWTCAFDPDSDEYQWLAKDLSESAKTWKIVMLHNPAYSAASLRDNGALIRQYLRPLFEATGVALVLAGHNHIYSRCEVGGIQYVTLGGGGGNLGRPVLTAPYVETGAAAHHFVRLEIRDGVLTSTAIDAEGSVLDSYTLTRSWTDLPERVLSSYGVSGSQVARMSSGYGDGSWRPFSPISRAQFAKMAGAAFAIDRASPAFPTFSDVAWGHHYYRYIEGAYASRLVRGVSEQMFGPDAPITREQSMGIIARHVARQTGFDLQAMTGAEISAVLAGFADRSSVSPSLDNEMAFGVAGGIIKGSTGGRLAPKDPINRLAAAALLVRAWGVESAASFAGGVESTVPGR